MLIAIASSDGETVNEHFGRADRFLIYDVSPGRHTLITVRNVKPYSIGNRDHQFDSERMASAAEAVRDCKLIYCSKIGDRPRMELDNLGITAIIGSRPISEIFE